MMELLSQEEALRYIYYTPREVGNFGGVDPLFWAAKKWCKTVIHNNVTVWLSAQDAYMLHKQARVNFKRNKIVVSGLDVQCQADLVDMQQFPRYNDGYKYSLTMVDILSE